MLRNAQKKDIFGDGTSNWTALENPAANVNAKTRPASARPQSRATSALHLSCQFMNDRESMRRGASVNTCFFSRRYVTVASCPPACTWIEEMAPIQAASTFNASPSPKFFSSNDDLSDAVKRLFLVLAMTPLEPYVQKLARPRQPHIPPAAAADVGGANIASNS